MKFGIYSATVAIFCLLSSVSGVYAAETQQREAAVIPCRSYDVTDGLSENSVRCILQDRQGYMWFGTKDGLSRYNGREFKVYGNLSDDRHLNVEYLAEHIDGGKIWIASRYTLELLDINSGRLSFIDLKGQGITKSFRALCYDRDGRLWAGSNSGLVVLEAGHSSEASDYKVSAIYRHVQEDPDSIPDDNIGSLLCDRNGNMWVGTENGLARYVKDENRFVTISTGNRTRHEHFLCLKEDDNGIIWAGTWDDGLYSINPNDGSIRNYFSPHGNSASVPIIRGLYHSDGSTIIICSNSGLFKYDKANGKLERLTLSIGLPNDSFYSCLKDHEGGLWIGTYFNGACYISPRAYNIEYYKPCPPQGLFSGTAVSEFCSNGGDRLWVGTENGGLSLLDRKNGEFVPIPWHDRSDNIHAIRQVDDELWVATFSSGLKRIDLRNGRVRSYKLAKDDYPDSENTIYSLYYSDKDNRGRLYIGMKKGCDVYDYGTNQIETIPQLDQHTVYCIFEDYVGKIWFSCHGDGVYCHDRHTGVWKFYRNDPGNSGSICSNRIINICCDAQGQLWFCSEGNGICRYDYSTDSFVAPLVSTEDGRLPCKVIFGLLDDNEGQLWMSSNVGIIRLDPLTGDYRQYTHEDGLQSDQFNFRSVFRTDDGKFWFGGVKGFNAFYPKNIRDNAIAPRVTAAVSYEDLAFYPSSGDIVIPSRVSNFSISFDCLSYVAPHRNVFEYRFNKRDKWTRTRQATVSFTDMKPGKYLFELRAVNSDGYRSDKDCCFSIVIKAPWYRSTAAIVIYIILAAAAASAAICTWLRIRRREVARRISEIKLRSEQESYNAKIQFFTQIAHEIKTPVTLIKAPLEIVMEHKVWDKETEDNLSIIEANTTRLTELINQLLDFKKISNEGYMLHCSEVNIKPVAEEVIRRFSTPANGSLRISFRSFDGGDGYEGLFDPDAVSKILSNLVENAVKYARSSINVELKSEKRESGSYIVLSVSNDGPGIPPEEAQKIFDTFYQVDGGAGKDRKPGFGIGLSLVSMLAQKSGGKVYVDENFTDGCRFCVELPWRKAAAEEQPTEDESLSGEKLTLLIVEDNVEVLNFLAEQLQSTYQVLKASDGQKALNVLERRAADIIISDIAMPNVDGFELLKAVRSNQLISHIPFILLSAESSVEAKIKGLESGADAYIEKPFSLNHFKAVIENLLNNRRSLMEKFVSSPEESLNYSGYGTLDAEWLAKVDSIIKANLASSGFSVQELADEMFTSRSNLQRKLKSLTGIAPNEYIKLIRLKKSAELLLSNNYRINEVCYMCGFSTPSYFTTCFFKQFGILPKEFVTLHKAETAT